MPSVLPFQRGPGRSPINARSNRGPGPALPAGAVGGHFPARPAGLAPGTTFPPLETTAPATTDAAPLPAPEPLSPARDGSAARGTVTLAWRAVDGAEQYFLSVCASPDMRAPCMVFDEPVQAAQSGSIVSVAMEFPSAGPFYWSVSAARSTSAARGDTRSTPRRVLITTAPETTAPATTTPAPTPTDTTTPAPTTGAPATTTGTPSPSPTAAMSGRGKAVIVLGLLALAGLGGKAVYDYGRGQTRAGG